MYPLNTLPDLTAKLYQTLIDEPPTSAREGGLIRSGHNAEIDRLKELAQGGRQWVAELEIRERERTGIKSLKVGYNKVLATI